MRIISGKRGTTISTFENTRSLWKSCAIFIEIQSNAGCANVRRTGSGAVFATTQPAVRDGSRSSRDGRRENANERREDFVQLSIRPTQAKTGLEWATRPGPQGKGRNRLGRETAPLTHVP